MSEVSVAALEEAIRNLHGCDSECDRTVKLANQAKVRGERMDVWKGVVVVFKLIDHPTAKIAYAWSSPVRGTGPRRFYAVLHEGPVTNAIAAVEASIVADPPRE